MTTIVGTPTSSGGPVNSGDAENKAPSTEVAGGAEVTSRPAATPQTSMGIVKREEKASDDLMDIDNSIDNSFEKSDSEAPTIVLTGEDEQRKTKREVRDASNDSRTSRNASAHEKKRFTADSRLDREASDRPDALAKKTSSKPTSRKTSPTIEDRPRYKSTSDILSKKDKARSPSQASKDGDALHSGQSPRKRKSRDDEDDTHSRSIERIRRDRSTEDYDPDRKPSRKSDSTNALRRRAQQMSPDDRSASPPRHRRKVSASMNIATSSSNPTKRRNIPPPLQPSRAASYSDGDGSDSSPASNPRQFARVKSSSVTQNSIMSPAKLTKGKNRDQNGRSLLTRACANGDILKVRAQLDAHPEDLDDPDHAGTLPIHEASIKGHAEIVKLLLDSGCSFDKPNYEGDTPLIDAVENGHLDVVMMLLEAGANPRKPNKKGNEPIDLINPDEDDPEEIRQALKGAIKRMPNRRISEDGAGRAASIAPESGRSSRDASTFSPRQSPPPSARTPPPIVSSRRRTGRQEQTRNDMLWFDASKVTAHHLREACAKGDVEMTVHILQAGQRADADSITAAARAGHIDVIQMLLGIGGGDADPDPDRQEVRLSKKSGETVKAKPGHNTPMLAVIGRGHLDIIELLLNQPDFNATRKAFKGLTYYELAKERDGPNWEKEYQVLKAAYDNQIGSRKGSPKSTKHTDKESLKRASSKLDSTSSPHKRKSTSTNDRDPDKQALKDKQERLALRREQSKSDRSPKRVSSTEVKKEADISSDRDADIKKRRKLVSGKAFREDREKVRRASISSAATADTALLSKTTRTSSPNVEPRTKASTERKNKKYASDDDVDMPDALPARDTNGSKLSKKEKIAEQEKRRNRSKDPAAKRNRQRSNSVISDQPRNRSRSRSQDPIRKKKRRLEGEAEKRSSSESKEPRLKLSEATRTTSTLSENTKRRDSLAEPSKVLKKERSESRKDLREPDEGNHRSKASSRTRDGELSPTRERKERPKAPKSHVDSDEDSHDELRRKKEAREAKSLLKSLHSSKAAKEKPSEEEIRAAEVAKEKDQAAAREREKQRALEEKDSARRNHLTAELRQIQLKAIEAAKIDRMQVEAEHERQILAERIEAERQEMLRKEAAVREQTRLAEERARIEAENRRRREAERRREDEERRERMRQEAEAERLRQLQRQEELRLASLPQTLREAARRGIRSPEEVRRYLPLRFASLFPPGYEPHMGITPLPKDNYITNVQASLILGVRDLQLSQCKSSHSIFVLR
jgi:hypothetical protein